MLRDQWIRKFISKNVVGAEYSRVPTQRLSPALLDARARGLQRRCDLAAAAARALSPHLLSRVPRPMLLDLTPLRRHPDFRRLFVGQLVSGFGSMLTYVAVPYQVYQLTSSSLMVGLLGTVQLV